MTEMTTTLLDNSYRNDISSDPLLDLNDFFFSKSGLIHHDEDDRDSMLIEEEDKKTLSSSTVNTFHSVIYLIFIRNNCRYHPLIIQCRSLFYLIKNVVFVVLQPLVIISIKSLANHAKHFFAVMHYKIW